MNFRAAVRMTGGSLSEDLSMDPSQDGGSSRSRGFDMAPSPKTDGGDPATPGGASPYNGAPPFGEPATSDPEWLDPQTQVDRPDRRPVPFIEGPNQMANTLHNARAASYAVKAARGVR